jgi:S-DNA-T family DNA segregation ATPase FtsK/SpoIIIE
MAKKNKNNNLKKEIHETDGNSFFRNNGSMIGKITVFILLLLMGILMMFGIFGSGGIVGLFLYKSIALSLFGYVGLLIPFILIYSSLTILFPERLLPRVLDMVTGTLLIIFSTGFLEMIVPSLTLGGSIGNTIGSLSTNLFSRPGGLLILFLTIVAGFFFLVRSSFNIIQWVRETFSSEYDEYDEEIYDDEYDEPVPDEPIIEAVQNKPDAFEMSLKDAEKASVKTKPVPEVDVPEMSIDPIQFSEEYTLPPLSLLSKSAGKPSVGDIRARGNVIKQTLGNFGIDVEMDEVSVGPTVTRYAMKPAQGVKLARIVALKQDLALSLAAHPLRIEAPIPGKSLVGIEIPNINKSSVGLGSLLESDEFQSSSERLLVALGKGVTGKSYYYNIGKMPHLLIAGTTGSGKSVTVHNLIMSLLYRNTPDELRLIMVDPKRVELTLYNDIPHLLTPVIKEPKKAVLALKWAAKEMERRYDLLEQHKVRDIKSYHENIVYPAYSAKKKDDEPLPEKMPYIVIIIDELADIMQAYPRELESAIVRLAQMSRATGIHLILSTQRPSVNVITGLIKANIPSRLALQVASQIDSRTILDTPGAESLLGRGDMLFQGADMSKPERMQAANIPEDEIKNVVAFIKKKNPRLSDHIIMSETLEDEKSIVGVNFDEGESDDPLYDDARRAVIEAGKASTSYLQRKLRVGYSRAARLIDLLEENGVVGPADGAKPREIIQQDSSSHQSQPTDTGDESETELFDEDE